MAEIIDGKALSKSIRAELKEKIIDLVRETGKEPVLAAILVGEDPASQIYVRNKIKACKDIGVKSLAYYLPDSATDAELEELISTVSADTDVDGILLQLPLPKGLDTKRALALIPPEKDVDGFSEVNIGKLFLGEETLVACTPYGVIKMLKSKDIDISGKHAVIIGRSPTVGRPLALLLLAENATVTVCHSKTADIAKYTRDADILIAALGKPKFVTADMVKDGAVVIDVGINRQNGELCGDVDFENVEKKASYISPVPGGVGPMTITMLMYNTYLSALRRKGN